MKVDAKKSKKVRKAMATVIALKEQADPSFPARIDKLLADANVPDIVLKADRLTQIEWLIVNTAMDRLKKKMDGLPKPVVD